MDQAAYLDTFPKAGAWASKAWKVLCCLQEYADARAKGEWTQPFRAWLLGSAEHGRQVVPDTWWAATESDSVTNNASYRVARTFEAGELGPVYMQAHIKIEPGGRPAPRIHVHDDTSGSTGLIWVGYFGGPLPNDQTN